MADATPEVSGQEYRFTVTIYFEDGTHVSVITPQLSVD